MGKYLITGRQGSGKTSVIKELIRRGFVAYNTDDLPNVTLLQNKITGEFIDWPKEGKVDWTKYAWNWQKPEIEKLLASDQTVFLGAVTNNQLEFYDLFDEVFVLTVDPQELEKRLSSHEHASHHVAGEIERLTHNHIEKQQQYIDEGATPVDANPPIAKIVDDLIKRLSLNSDDPPVFDKL